MKNFLRLFLSFFFCLCVFSAHGQSKLSNNEYAEKYSGIAIEKMKQYKIPASITLAQGILESGAGSSRLAVVANNHFGIKCGKSWQGRRIYHDDDQKGECFRSYGSASESFNDHSLFLTSNQRYAFLFTLDIMDYKGWAKGLKAAGYATNPKYPELLIKLIEEHKLYEYDYKGATASRKEIGGLVGWLTQKDKAEKEEVEFVAEPKFGKRKTGKVNGVKFIVANQGDSFESISTATGISVEKLLKFNDLYSTMNISEGSAIYIAKKKTKSRRNYMHEVKKGETNHSISQLYGIQLKSFYKLNPQYANRQPIPGAYVRLR